MVDGTFISKEDMDITRYSVEVFDQNQHSASDIAPAILKIHHRIFPQLVDHLFSDPNDSPRDRLEKRYQFKAISKYKRQGIINLINNPRSVLILCKDNQKDEYIGYSLSVPIGLADGNRVSENQETAYIYNVGLEPRQQGLGLVGQIMPKNEEEMRVKGYQFFEGDFRIENGFAAKIEKNYNGRIVSQRGPHQENEFAGLQMFYRIRL